MHTEPPIETIYTTAFLLLQMYSLTQGDKGNASELVL